MYSDEQVLAFVKQKLNQGIPISLRQIAKHFNTSHSQIKRILKRNNFLHEYFRQRKELEELDEFKPFSVDIELNTQKSVRYKPICRIGFICDLHLGHHDEEAIALAIDFLKDQDITHLIIGGDLIDFESISYWKNLNKYSLREEIEMAKDFLSWLRFNFPKQKIYYIEANHELRASKYLISNAKEFAYLDELKLENLLRLDRFNITYISNTKLLQQNKSPFKIGHLVFLHGHEIKTAWSLVNIARTMYLKAQDNIIFGHFHSTQEYIFRNISNEVRGAWSVGCLCNLSPDYSPVNNWNHGFAFIEIFDDGSFIVDNKKIIDGKIL